ncbi:MAG: aldolase/citrate lyase family protein, partial [Dehalococcoidia bacterium]
RGIPVGSIEIGANVETARGVANAQEIAAASPRMKDFGGGGGYDMSRDLGVEMFVAFDQFVYGAGELELAARAQGLEVHSTPFIPNLSGSVGDGEHALQVAEATRRSGFYIGGGLHPNVVEPQNRGFAATSREVDEAQRTLELYEDLESSGQAWMEVEGRVVDRYEAQRARGLLEWAQLCARRDREKVEAVQKADGLDDE